MSNLSTSSDSDCPPPGPSGGGPSAASLVNPLCIILVKNGSKGDRLLFRYPYTKPPTTNTHQTKTTTGPGPGTDDPQGQGQGPRHRRKLSDLLRSREAATSMPLLEQPQNQPLNFPYPFPSTSSPFLAVDPGGLPPGFGGGGGSDQKEGRSGSISRLRKNSRNSPAGLLFSNIAARHGHIHGHHHSHGHSRGSGLGIGDKSANTSDGFIDDHDGPIMGMGQNGEHLAKFSPADGAKMMGELSDKDLSNLLAVGAELAEKKFELKLNYVRFVGHPTLMQRPNSYRNSNHAAQTSVKLFHVVFCLNAVASHSIVKCFHDLSKRLGIALRHEEYRCGYLTQQFRNMITLHDEFCTESEDKDDEERVQGKMFDEILLKSSLAQLLKVVYDDVVKTGRTYTPVNDWIQISFCLPQKIHTLKFRDESQLLVEPEAIHKCLEAIRPFHAILLLVDADDLSSNLWFDASSTISRLLQVYSPLKSLQTLAADADLTLSQVVEIASHLVYWAQATVIYPLCESNIYVVSPDIPITSEKLRKQFAQHFPGLSLAQTLADFSLPMPLGERINPVVGGNYMQAQQVQLVTWMLKYHLLIHLQTYIYLTTYFDGTDGFDNGLDYLTAFTGTNLDGSANYSLNIRPFEADEDEATASDSFSEVTIDDVTNIVNNININGKEKLLEKDSVPVTPTASENPTTAAPEGAGAGQGAGVGESFPELNEAVRRAINMVSTKSPLNLKLSVQDVKLFNRLSRYFTGDFHMEEIMYRENVRRSQLLLLLDKFRDVLITIEKEDAEINFFKLS